MWIAKRWSGVAEAKDVVVNVLTSTITTLAIIFLLIPLLKIPVPAVKETETIKEKHYYPVPVVLEGDYSTWTEIAGSPITFAHVGQISYAVISEDGKFGVILDQYSYYSALFKIEPPAVISETSNTAIGQTAPVSACGSVLGKYTAVFYTSDATHLYIYKNGVLTQTITLDFHFQVAGCGLAKAVNTFLQWTSAQNSFTFTKEANP